MKYILDFLLNHIEKSMLRLAVFMKWELAPETPAHTPVSPEIIPETINATTTPATPVLSQSGAPSAVSTPSALDFSTQKAAYHSTRVICDQVGLTFAQKEIVCACIFQESEFLTNPKPFQISTPGLARCGAQILESYR